MSRHYKKDGSLDMRYTSSRQAVASGSGYSSGGGYGSGYGGMGNYGSSSNAGLYGMSSSDYHYKKDGTLDMRYSSSKAAVNAAQSDDYLHYKKDGSLDMRYTSSRAAHAASTTSSSSSSSKHLVDKMAQMQLSQVPSHVPLTKSGAPDMRTTAAKEWILEQAKHYRENDNLPSWVPMRKDGTVDSTKPIGRMFAEHRSTPHVDRRQIYWQQRKQDSSFIELLTRERTESVTMPRACYLPNSAAIRSKLQSIAAEQQLQRSRSTTPQEMSASLPDNVTVINYSELSLGDELGRGAFGVVRKATYKGETVAVKQLLLERLTKGEAQSFHKEVAILALLSSHPNLVKMLGCVQEPPCIVLQYIELGSLGNLLHYCTKPEVEAKMTDGRIKKRLMLGTVDGMRELHAAGVIHADLKPQNVLVTEDYQAKISDFGLSRLRGKTSSSSVMASVSGSEQKETFVGGTAAYMAPELLDSSAEPTFSVDVYAFGILLNEVISEQEPYCDQYSKFLGRGVFGVVNYARLGNRPTISPATSSNVTTLINDCWSAEANSRPTFEKIFTRMSSESLAISDSVTVN